MSKIYIPLPKKADLKLYLEHGFDGFFIGINNYSYGFNNLIEVLSHCLDNSIVPSN